MSLLSQLQRFGIEQDYSKTLYNLRVEAATHFALVGTAAGAVWATGYLYGFWVGRLEELQHLDKRVEQLANFTRDLGTPPQDPPFEPKGWTFE